MESKPISAEQVSPRHRETLFIDIPDTPCTGSNGQHHQPHSADQSGFFLEGGFCCRNTGINPCTMAFQ